MRWVWHRLRSSHLRGDDKGVTLVELSVSIMLIGVISAFVSGAVIGAQKVIRTGDDQSRGLEQVRTAAERLARDIRDARGVLCNPTGTAAAVAAADPSCTYHLQVWIDYNSDYVQQSDETVTWQLKAGTSAGHFSLVRTAGSHTQVEASAIVKQVAFSYDYPPASAVSAPGAVQTKLVNVNMTYDALYGLGKTSNRTIVFSGRLRNVS
jgi:prepilin-type N-terminal cleavage/methylation domain-containing protein